MSLLVTVTGSDKVKVTEVTLVDSSSQMEVNGTLQARLKPYKQNPCPLFLFINSQAGIG